MSQSHDRPVSRTVARTIPRGWTGPDPSRLNRADLKRGAARWIVPAVALSLAALSLSWLPTPGRAAARPAAAQAMATQAMAAQEAAAQEARPGSAPAVRAKMDDPEPVRARPQRLVGAPVAPSAGQTGVRPDTPLEFKLGPQLARPGGAAVRAQLAKRRFEILVVGATGGARRLSGKDQGVAVDLETGLITARLPEPLPRYAWHAAVLRLHQEAGEGLERWLEGLPAALGRLASEPSELPAPPARAPWLLWTVFRTGSDLHEPTHLELVREDAERTAGEAASCLLAVTDDYGLPAWDVTVSTFTQESGARLPGSAVTAPGSATAPGLVTAPGQGLARALGPADEGRVEIRCVDPEAEAVEVSVSAACARYGFEARHRWRIRFRPGAPAVLTLAAPVPRAAVGEELKVLGSTTDSLGNGVPGEAVTAEAWGTAAASWRQVGGPIVTGDDGSFSFRLASPVPQCLLCRAGLAAGPAAALDRPLWVTDDALTPDKSGAAHGAGRILVRARTPEAPGSTQTNDPPQVPSNIPLRAAPPDKVEAAPGTFPPTATITARVLTNVGSWDPWATPVPGTAAEQTIGSGPASADGSLSLSTQVPFAAGEVLAIEVGDPAPPPAPEPAPQPAPVPAPPPAPEPAPLHLLTGVGQRGVAYAGQTLPPGSYRVSLWEDSAVGPERFIVFYYHLVRHNGYTEGILNGLLDTGLVNDMNGSTCVFSLREQENIGFELQNPGPTFNYRISIFPAP